MFPRHGLETKFCTLPHARVPPVQSLISQSTGRAAPSNFGSGTGSVAISVWAASAHRAPATYSLELVRRDEASYNSHAEITHV